MPASTPLVTPAAIVVRLRAAGCVYAEEEAELLVAAAPTPDELEVMVQQRVNGLPLEPILGWAQFCGLRIAVAFGVFIPRRRTEFLVQQAAALAPPGPVVVDLCCGSGAIGMALAAELEGIDLYAADIDPVAIHCARRNIVPAGGQVFEGDLYDALPDAIRGQVGLLVVNAPYVPTDAIGLMPPEARIHEARVALDGGADGLDVQRRVAAEAMQWLAPGGHVVIETSVRQSPRTAEILTRSGLITRVAHSDDLDATIAIGARPV